MVFRQTKELLMLSIWQDVSHGAGERARMAALAASLFCLAAGAAGCASDREFYRSTGSVADRQRVVRAEELEEERPFATPADPYKDVQYRGGRDPVTGVAIGAGGKEPQSRGASSRPGAQAGMAQSGRVASAAEDGTTVTVQPGETLSALATRHRVTVGAIMQANRLASDRVIAGQRLVIPNS